MKKNTQRRCICWLAVLLGISLMVGESARSWGRGRPVTNWFDDFVLAFFLLFGAYKTLQAAKHVKILAAGWAVSFMALTFSYLNKMAEPDQNVRSNLSFGLLTTLLLVASVASFVGLLWTLVVDFSEDDRS